MCRATLLVAALALAAPAYAIDPGRRLTQYARDLWTVENGLPQNDVLAIVQDASGFLWLGTEEGFARFDGTHFTAFDTNNLPGLGGGFVVSIAIDRRGDKWLGTLEGLTRIHDGRARTFTTADGLPADLVRTLLLDGDGSLLVGTDGGVARMRGGRLARVDGIGDIVRVLYRDREGRVFAGDDAGELYRIVDRVAVKTTPLDLPRQRILALLEDRAGSLWIGTWGSGLCHVEKGRCHLFGAADGLPSNAVQALYQDKDGNLWIGTWGGGLARKEVNGFSVLSGRERLASERVRGFFEDREGSLWIGTYGGLERWKNGSLVVFGKAEGLASDSTWAVLEDARGAVWVGTDDGADKLVGDRVVARALPGKKVSAFAEDQRGHLWIGTFTDGVYELAGDRALRHDEVGNIIAGLGVDRAGQVWIGSADGVSVYDGRSFRHYTVKDGLPSGYVLSIHQDQSGAVWLLAQSGLARFADGKITRYTVKDGLAENIVTVMHEGKDGALWFGNISGALNRWRDGRFTVVVPARELTRNFNAFLEDPIGNFWLSGNHGIVRVGVRALTDFAAGRARHLDATWFGRDEGMRSAETNSGQPPGLEDRQGRLWFPTPRGVVRIDPRHLPENRVAPDVLIEEVRADGKLARANEALRMKPGTRELTIRYTGTSLAAPERMAFRYRLFGFDPDWVDAKGRREVRYTNLPPGSYEFAVAGRNSDGTWSRKDAVLAVTMLPFYWQTAWFKLLVGFLIALALGASWTLRIQQLRRRERALVELVAERDAFLSLVSHELKTPLTRLHLLLQGLASGGRRPAPEMLVRQTTKLSRLVDLLLNVSQAQAGLRLGQRDDVDLVAVAREVIDRFVEEPEGPGGAVVLEAAAPVVGYWDRAGVEQVVMCLVGNAIKFGDGKPVEVGVDERNGQARLVVRDHGIGIPAERLPRLFQRFERAVSWKHYRGIGLGLYLVREIVRAHGGSVRAESELGHGSTFTVELPC